MRQQSNLPLSILLSVCLFSLARGETIYFLVAEIAPAQNHSYVLPLSEPNNIAHARDLIKYGTSAGPHNIVAQIACGADGINRNFVARSKPLWAWHVTNFVEFNNLVTIFNGSPAIVQNDCEWWMNNRGGQIGFLNYTVVGELGTDPNHWRRDFDSDEDVDLGDFAWLGMHWWWQDCNQPDWCNGADLDNSGTVDLSDLAVFMESWLSTFADEPLWFESWDNPRQCHGDAADDLTGSYFTGYTYVGATDLAILWSVKENAEPGCWPAKSGHCFNYIPCVDFDHDLDVDDLDVDIMARWFEVKEPPHGPGVPADCPQR